MNIQIFMLFIFILSLFSPYAAYGAPKEPVVQPVRVENTQPIPVDVKNFPNSQSVKVTEFVPGIDVIVKPPYRLQVLGRQLAKESPRQDMILLETLTDNVQSYGRVPLDSVLVITNISAYSLFPPTTGTTRVIYSTVPIATLCGAAPVEDLRVLWELRTHDDDTVQSIFAEGIRIPYGKRLCIRTIGPQVLTSILGYVEDAQ